VSRQGNLFEGGRLQMTHAIELTIDSLMVYGATHAHWAIAWSGGKDSTTLLTLVVWLILTRRVPAPRSLTVLYADTRMELTPLWLSAQTLREELEERALDLAELGTVLCVATVMAPLDKRFLPYMLGRGVPPPNNGTLRWCTEQIKIKPMEAALAEVAVAHGLGEMVEEVRRGTTKLVYRGFGQEKLLVLTGVRQGESAIRDGRIAMSCSRGDAECGQGWYQETLPTSLCDTLAPILHWRVCHVWEWLRSWATKVEFGDWTTGLLADAYGGEEAEEAGARTGCVGCPLASEDRALDRLLRMPQWAYLAPLKGLRALYRELRTPPVRLRKEPGERRKDGTLVANQQRMGPITLDGRRRALARVLAIQAEVNAAADTLRRPRIDILNDEEVARITELIDAGTWPQKWNGDEPTADEPFDSVFADGSMQPLLAGLRLGLEDADA
jgi:DNA sulfur modification protein DndC